MNRDKSCEKLMSGAGILPASDAIGGENAWLPASPERGRDARATRFSYSLTIAPKSSAPRHEHHRHDQGEQE
jgi:hypothetical protein